MIRTPAALAAAALAAAAVLAGCSGGQQAGTRPASVAAADQTSQGPDGVRAQWVIDENKRPGTTAWRIHGAHGGIAGFASRVYAGQGEQIGLYVSTTGPWFQAQAYRMGYYQGKGARLVWRSGRVPGRRQPHCPLTRKLNMVACDNWSRSLSFPVTRAFVPGDYLIKLAGPGNRQTYVPLTVWDPASHATYLIKNDVFTWQAWNSYGGYDFYTGRGNCSAASYPLCSRARVVSFDRPYEAEDGSGNFLTLEYPLVRYAEQRGLDVSYATDLTVQDHPQDLANHRVLLSLGHDECWSLPERQAAVRAHERGQNIVFFAASPVLRHVRTQPSPLGPGREEADYRDPAEDPVKRPLLVTANTWGSPPTNWPEYGFVGDTYAGFLEPGVTAGFRVTDASAWVFRGTGLRDGSVIPGVVGSDVDKFDKPSGQPANDQVLSHSPLPAGQGQTDLGAFYSDMTYYTDPGSGAGVLDTGTNNWIPAILHDRDGCGGHGRICARTAVQRITGNILRAFGEGPAGHAHTSAANWRQVDG